MTRHKNPKMRLRNHIVTRKEEEVPRKTRWWKKFFQRKRKRQRRRSEMLHLWKGGHKSWECPERNKEGEGEAHISEA
jgi:hypothetical protein